MATEEAFLKAARTGNLQPVLEYIEENRGNTAKLNATDHSGDTALIEASRIGNIEMVTALLGTDGINVNAANQSNGFTALLWAVHNGHVAVVNVLLRAKGINVNAATSYGKNTPLIMAVEKRNIEIFNALQDVDGLNLNAVNNIGHTALSMAEHKGYTELANALLIMIDPDRYFDKHSAEDFMSNEERIKLVKADPQYKEEKLSEDVLELLKSEMRTKILALEKLFSHPNHKKLTEGRLQKLAYHLYEALPLFSNDTAKQKELAYKALSYFETIPSDHDDYPDAALAIYCIRGLFGESEDREQLYKQLFTDRNRIPWEKDFKTVTASIAKEKQEVVEMLADYAQDGRPKRGFFDPNANRKHKLEVRQAQEIKIDNYCQLLALLNNIKITDEKDSLVRIRQYISWHSGAKTPLTINKENHDNDDCDNHNQLKAH